jgi:hypothetical protein
VPERLTEEEWVARFSPKDEPISWRPLCFLRWTSCANEALLSGVGDASPGPPRCRSKARRGATVSRRNRSPAGHSRNRAELTLEIARIGDLDAAALRALWPAWFGAPPRMQRATLAIALAHRIQSATLAGLSQISTRILDAVADQEFGRAGQRIADPPRRLKPGTKLLREWHGVVHEVAVVDGGFVWNGARHRSLSAIARAITGTLIRAGISARSIRGTCWLLDDGSLISRRIGSTGINHTADEVDLGELVLIERRAGADGIEAARPCRHLRIEHPARRCRVREAHSGKPQAHIMFGGGLCEEQLKFNDVGLESLKILADFDVGLESLKILADFIDGRSDGLPVGGTRTIRGIGHGFSFLTYSHYDSAAMTRGNRPRGHNDDLLRPSWGLVKRAARAPGARTLKTGRSLVKT